MYESWEQYKSGEQAMPSENVVWHLYGVGLETLGRNKAPETKALPQPGPDELLARVDAAGLCFSDTKIIKLGGDHPRLYGRDLANDPIIPGHEAAVTIVAVGENRVGKYSVGDRFVVQADAYYKGVNLAFGYMLPGALEQYVIIGTNNIDNRSLHLNFEISLVISNEALAREAIRRFNADLEKTCPSTDCRQLAFIKRLAIKIMRLFAPVL